MVSMLLMSISKGEAQNPIVSHCFTADPAPAVFDGIDSLYVYCDQDENVPGVNDFYFMEHYRVFSTADMVNWTDHGDMAMPRTAFKWLKKGVCWASQCVKKGNSYYWYVCGEPGVSGYGYNVIGVGRSKKPSGPFTDPKGTPIISAFGYIDPTVLVDEDGQAYMYFGNNMLKYVKLNALMTSYRTAGTGSEGGVYTIPLNEQTVGGYKDDNGTIIGQDKYEEGPWLDRRGDKYYMIYAAGGVPEHISYSMSSSPEGPWEYKGIIMPTGDTGSFTNHCGIANFRGHDYFFYHTGWASINGVGGGGFNRSMAVEEFTFNEDGTIPQIKPTRTGVKALDTLNPYLQQQAETLNQGMNLQVTGNEKKGVYVTGITHKTTMRIANVDFGDVSPASLTIRYASTVNAGTLYVRQGSATGTILAKYALQSTGGEKNWQEVTIPLTRQVTGTKKYLYFTFSGTPDSETGTLMNFDWWKFNTPEEDGILSVTETTSRTTQAGTFDLFGRCVHPERQDRGIYIRNGKKIIVSK